MASALKHQQVVTKVRWTQVEEEEEQLRTKEMVRFQAVFNPKMILFLGTLRLLLATSSPGRRRVSLAGRWRTAPPSPP